VKAIEGGRQPHAIARQDGKPLAFAGLWESYRWPDETVLRSFTIMTTTPNAEMDDLHDRMPVILDEPDWPVWLGETEGDHTALLRPAPDGLLRTWPVDRRVGSPRNNGPELLVKLVAGSCQGA
jgi:putative SOS response-associated peptidase YedK